MALSQYEEIVLNRLNKNRSIPKSYLSDPGVGPALDKLLDLGYAFIKGNSICSLCAEDNSYTLRGGRKNWRVRLSANHKA
jgi:hypothetical protein